MLCISWKCYYRLCWILDLNGFLLRNTILHPPALLPILSMNAAAGVPYHSSLCRIWWLVTLLNVLYFSIIVLNPLILPTFCQPRMTVDVVSCFIPITSDSHRKEQTFIKCEQTNLILAVSKLENLLTKLIFQFYSISPHPSWLFSLYICIIVLSPLRTWFITFTLVWNDISFLRRWRMLSICVSVVTVSVSITGNVQYGLCCGS